jgi:hypothetical protein
MIPEIQNALRRTIALLRRFQFRRDVEVVVIASRHGHFLSEISKNQTSLFLDPIRFPIILSAKFIWTFFRINKSVSRVSQYVIATAVCCNSRAVVATDAIKELTEIAKGLPGVEVIAVMHGFYIDQKDSMLREQWNYERESPVTLFALGDYDITHYRRWGNKHKKIMPVGSVNNCLYLKHRDVEHKVFDLCIIQGSLNPLANDVFSLARLRNWELIIDYVNKLNSLIKLRISVALNSSSKEESIRNWIEDRLADATFFRSSIEPFATYRAVDSSLISIGEASTAIVEGLARGNRCIAMNFSELDLLSLPLPPILSLHRPSFEEFHDRFNLLRQMPAEKFSELVADDVRKVINVDEQDLAITKIQTYIDQVCDKTSLVRPKT